MKIQELAKRIEGKHILKMNNDNALNSKEELLTLLKIWKLTKGATIGDITNNQINQAWINIALGISLIIMSYLYFNYLFGIISLIALTLIMYFQIKKGSIIVDDIDKNEYSIFISLILIIFGIIFLIYGSDLFVNSAISSAKK